MTFNTIIPTMEEVENLPNYQIEFKDWDPQKYYDDLHPSSHNNSNSDKGNSNTEAILSSATQNPTTSISSPVFV